MVILKLRPFDFLLPIWVQHTWRKYCLEIFKPMKPNGLDFTSNFFLQTVDCKIQNLSKDIFMVVICKRFGLLAFSCFQNSRGLCRWLGLMISSVILVVEFLWWWVLKSKNVIPKISIKLIYMNDSLPKTLLILTLSKNVLLKCNTVIQKIKEITLSNVDFLLKILINLEPTIKLIS